VLDRAYSNSLTVHTSGLDTGDVRIFPADRASAFPVILRTNNRS